MSGAKDRLNALKETHIVQIDILDDAFVVVCFSNGISARLPLEAIRQLVISSAVEFVSASDDLP